LVLDPRKKLVEFYKSNVPSDAKIVVSKRIGLSYARNTGAREAKSDIVAFIDDDAFADERWLENLTRHYQDPTVMGVGGYVKPVWSGKRPGWFPEELDWIVGCSYKSLPEKLSTVRNPIGCNMSYRKKVFERIGYFASDIGRFGTALLSKEETEFSMRLLSRIVNSRIIYDPSSIVYHKVTARRQNLRYLWRRSFSEGVSKVLIDKRSLGKFGGSTEDSYLRYLLKVAIPLRLHNISNGENLRQLLVLFLSISGVFTGFLLAKIQRQ